MNRYQHHDSELEAAVPATVVTTLMIIVWVLVFALATYPSWRHVWQVLSAALRN